MTNQQIKNTIKARLHREQMCLATLKTEKQKVKQSIAMTQAAIIAYQNAIDDIPNDPSES